MQPPQDQSAFEWIRATRIHSRSPDSPRRTSRIRLGITVADLVPEFEAYARILHRIDACYEEIDTPLSASEKATLKIPDCEPLKSFLQSRRTASLTDRIRWQELAALLNLPFVPEISFSWFRKRMDGWCVSRLLRGSDTWPTGDECEEVCSVLKRFSDDKECFFRFPDHVLYSVHERPLLLRGSVNDVSEYLKGCYPYFEYWWPADRQWCVCDDDDLGVTIVGGPRKLISALLASSILECIKVRATTRVDDRVPIPEA
jgi:hypothetical protein